MKKRDKEYRKQQEQKKSYKAFRQEVNRNKIRNEKSKGGKKRINLEQIDYNNLTEEEIEEIEEQFYDEE